MQISNERRYAPRHRIFGALFVILLTAVMAAPKAAFAQKAVVTMPASFIAVAGAGTASFTASVTPTDPTLTSEQSIAGTSYKWTTTAGTCSPATSSMPSTTVAVSETSPGDYSATVTCTVTWTVFDTTLNANLNPSPSASDSETCTVHMGVLWTIGGFDGGVVINSPQDQTQNPYSPLKVVELAGARVGCSVTTPKPYDVWTFNTGNPSTGKDYKDTPTYSWTASAGTLSSTTTQSTTLTLPNSSCDDAVTCTVSATAPKIGQYDGGTRGPSPVSPSVTVYVPTFSIQVRGIGGSYGSSATVGANIGDLTEADVEVTASDSKGNPLSGATVNNPTLSANSAGAFVPATVSCSGTTDVKGHVDGTYTAGDDTVTVTITTAQGGATASVTQDWNDNPNPWQNDTNAWDWDTPLTITYNMELSDEGDYWPLDGHILDFVTDEIEEYDYNPNGDETDADGDPIAEYDYHDYYEDSPDGDVSFSPASGDITYAGPADSGQGNYTGTLTVASDDSAIVVYVGTDIEDQFTYGSGGYTP